MVDLDDFLGPRGHGDQLDEEFLVPNYSTGQSSFYCHKLNCSKDKSQACQDSFTTESCHPGDGVDYACFALWTNDSDHGVRALYKGCWPSQTGQTICDADTCKTDRLGSTKKDGIETYYCCCEKSGCNAQFTYELPTTTQLPVPGQTPALNDNSLWTILTLTLSVFGFAALIVLVYFFYRRRKMSASEGALGKEKGINLPFFNNTCRKQIKFEIKSLISRGRFGAVYQAVLENGDVVAVKIFPASDQDSWIQEQDIYNLPLMSAHENILHFIAVDISRTDPREYCLFTTYLENGSLHDYLKAHIVTFKEMLHIAITMLKGLSFLHEEKYCKDGRYKPIICHRDFKSRNVLLNKDLTSCVSDFGLAIKCGHGKTAKETHGQVGTRRYMAPEVLQGATEFSASAFKQIDIYAAALVLWEIFSRCVISNAIVDSYTLPYEDSVGSKPSLEDMYDIVVVQNVRPLIKNEWLQDPRSSVIGQTIQEMWDTEFEARLTASGALQRFLALDQPTNSVSFSSLSFNDRSSQHETTPLINGLVNHNSINPVS